jgi:hypothetical protein
MRLSAVFLCEPPDEAGQKPPREFNGSRRTLPGGRIVEVRCQRVPLYGLARELDRLGYGDWLIQAHTPEGRPSLRGLVTVVAELTVEESDSSGLRLRKFHPLPPGGAAVERDDASAGTLLATSEAIAAE